MVNVFLLIAGMTLVTYIPRALSAILVDKLRFGGRVEKFLKLIPYTAMSALIFPGVFTVDAVHPAIGIAGGAVAAALAWRKCPVMVCVLAAIAADLLLYLWLGQR
jgi:branched-subunit amino acid transport protein